MTTLFCAFYEDAFRWCSKTTTVTGWSSRMARRRSGASKPRDQSECEPVARSGSRKTGR